MTYTFEMDPQQCEMTERNSKSFSVPVTLVLKKGGRRISFARDAFQYYCSRIDGRKMYRLTLLEDIANDSWEETYRVDYSQLTDEEIIEQLVNNLSEGERITAERIEDLLYDFYLEGETKSAHDEFIELFRNCDFFPIPSYT